ncbi:MAG: glutaredoxin [Actinobacteria bacterium]|nr:glutaredoxin [Actinomycetota bacterium]
MTVAAARAVRVTLVTAPGCHFCEEAHRELSQLTAAGAPIELTVVEATSEAGSRLLRAHRPAMNPLVVVDGRYFSAGRFPRRKFHALLSARPTSEGVRHG